MHTVSTCSNEIFDKRSLLWFVIAMPLMVDSDEDHFYIVTVIGGVLWGVFYAGCISTEDFAYACQGHAKGAIVALPGVTRNSFVSKCKAAETSLVLHYFVVC